MSGNSQCLLIIAEVSSTEWIRSYCLASILRIVASRQCGIVFHPGYFVVQQMFWLQQCLKHFVLSRTYEIDRSFLSPNPSIPPRIFLGFLSWILMAATQPTSPSYPAGHLWGTASNNVPCSGQKGPLVDSLKPLRHVADVSCVCSGEEMCNGRRNCSHSLNWAWEEPDFKQSYERVTLACLLHLPPGLAKARSSQHSSLGTGDGILKVDRILDWNSWPLAAAWRPPPPK